MGKERGGGGELWGIRMKLRRHRSEAAAGVAISGAIWLKAADAAAIYGRIAPRRPFLPIDLINEPAICIEKEN